MQKLTFILYGVWAAACIVLKILGMVSWWVATSFVWLPAGTVLSLACVMFLVTSMTYKIKEKKQRKIPDTCDICLFGVTRKFSEGGKCIGERNGSEYGKICPYYRRHLGE